MAEAQGSNNISTLNGNFKETYADKMERLIPEGLKVINTIKFVSKDRMPKYWAA